MDETSSVPVVAPAASQGSYVLDEISAESI